MIKKGSLTEELQHEHDALLRGRHPSHRCKVCHALWIEYMDGWSLFSKHCGPCCDNSVDFLSNIEELPVLLTASEFALQWRAKEISSRSKFEIGTNANYVLELLQDGCISVGKGREWLREWILEGKEGSLPERNTLTSTWDEIDKLKAELSALRESAKLAEAVAEAVYQYSISGTDWRHKLADISDSVAAWRAHRAKSLEGGE